MNETEEERGVGWVDEWMEEKEESNVKRIKTPSSYIYVPGRAERKKK